MDKRPVPNKDVLGGKLLKNNKNVLVYCFIGTLCLIEMFQSFDCTGTFKRIYQYLSEPTFNKTLPMIEIYSHCQS